MKRKKIIVGVLILVLLLAMAACGGKEDKIVAKVGDREISESQLDQFMYFYGFMQAMDLESLNAENLAYIRTLILEEYINVLLVLNEFEGEDAELPEELVAEADEFIKQVKEHDASASYMKRNNISDEFMKEVYTNQYFSKLFYDELYEATPDATEEEVKKYYDENTDYFIIDEVEARHILVEDEKLAEELLVQLKGGADFADLAKEHSICPSKEDGGNLGAFGRGQMVQEFEEAAFALKKGELSGVVESSFGFHIIESLARTEEVQAFEEVKDDLFEFMKDLKIRDEYDARITQLREKYEVEYV